MALVPRPVPRGHVICSRGRPLTSGKSTLLTRGWDGVLPLNNIYLDLLGIDFSLVWYYAGVWSLKDMRQAGGIIQVCSWYGNGFSYLVIHTELQNTDSESYGCTNSK